MALPRLEENKHKKGTGGRDQAYKNMGGKRRKENFMCLNEEHEFVLVCGGKHRKSRRTGMKV